jgi:hypothetical protein
MPWQEISFPAPKHLTRRGARPFTALPLARVDNSIFLFFTSHSSPPTTVNCLPHHVFSSQFCPSTWSPSKELRRFNSKSCRRCRLVAATAARPEQPRRVHSERWSWSRSSECLPGDSTRFGSSETSWHPVLIAHVLPVVANGNHKPERCPQL